MKCPQCSTDSKKPERPEGKCPKCGYRFVFDPPAPISDYAFSQLVQKVSSDGTYSFTREQLICEVERAILRKDATAAVAVVFAVLLGIVTVGITIAAVAALGVLGVLAAPIGIALMVLVYRKTTAGKPRHAPEAAILVKTFVDTAGALPKMVSPRDPPGHALPGLGHEQPAREFDLESYGFDRIVAVQHRAIVDMLVANNFHVQHNAAIVSFDGYPAHVAKLVGKQIASGQVNAAVYVLHDAGPAGLIEAEQWLKSGWLGATPVIRLGLFPGQAEKLRPHVPIDGRQVMLPGGTSTFVASQVPLAALRPIQVMNLLLNGFQKGVSDDGMLVIWATSDGGGYDFG